MKKRKFWMVIRESGSRTEFRHETYAEAEALAIRLAREERGGFFIVAAVTGGMTRVAPAVPSELPIDIKKI